MKKLSLFLSILILFALVVPAYAQDNQPPVDPSGAWGEVVDQNGNIQYGNMTDLGVVTTQEEWMPSIPGIGSIPAEYHEYQTESGNIVLMPSPLTLFCMAANSDVSGIPCLMLRTH